MDSGLKINLFRNISRHRKPSGLLGGKAGEVCHSGSIYNRKKVSQKYKIVHQ